MSEAPRKYTTYRTGSPEDYSVYQSGGDTEQKIGFLSKTAEKIRSVPTELELAALAILLASGIAVGCGNKNVSPETATPSVATAPSPSVTEQGPRMTYGETETSIKANSAGVETLSATPTADEIKVDAELSSNPEALISAFTERSTAWFNAGATFENAEAALNSTTESFDDAAARIASEYDLIFIQNLVVGGDTLTSTDEASINEHFQSKPDLAAWINKMIAAHRETLTLYFYTAFSNINPLDIEAYRRTTESDKVISSKQAEDGSLVVQDEEKDSDNSDKNRVGEKLTAGATVLGDVAIPTRTFVVIGNHIWLSDISLASL